MLMPPLASLFSIFFRFSSAAAATSDDSSLMATPFGRYFHAADCATPCRMPRDAAAAAAPS